MEPTQKLLDKENDRVIYFTLEKNTVTAIDFRQGISDESEYFFEPENEILEYYKKIISRVQENEIFEIGDTLKKAVEVYCYLNIY